MREFYAMTTSACFVENYKMLVTLVIRLVDGYKRACVFHRFLSYKGVLKDSPLSLSLKFIRNRRMAEICFCLYSHCYNNFHNINKNLLTT